MSAAANSLVNAASAALCDAPGGDGTSHMQRDIRLTKATPFKASIAPEVMITRAAAGSA